jgi:hypothetical protein
MTTTNESIPWWAHALLLRPARIADNLELVRRAGIVEHTPNLWQLSLGVLRMWHRVLFRSETVGTCTDHPVRHTWRARILQYRVLRVPFLIAERAIAPLDFSGLVSSPERVMCHLLAAHHDKNQFAYDLQMLAAHPGWLERVRDEAKKTVESRDARARWLRDLVVYDGYHESLLSAVERALRGDYALPPEDASDPDVSFVAYLHWCARQPPTPRDTIALARRGAFSIASGVNEGASC